MLNKNELICEDINDLKCLIQTDNKGNKYINFNKSDVYCDFDVNLEGVNLLNANKLYVEGSLIAKNINVANLDVDNHIKANYIDVETIACTTLNCIEIQVFENHFIVNDVEKGNIEYIRPFHPSDVFDVRSLL
jgi:hypothetical protein